MSVNVQRKRANRCPDHPWGTAGPDHEEHGSPIDTVTLEDGLTADVLNIASLCKSLADEAVAGHHHHAV